MEVFHCVLVLAFGVLLPDSSHTRVLFSGRRRGNLLEWRLYKLTHELGLATILTPDHCSRERFAIRGHCVDIARPRVHWNERVAHFTCKAEVDQVSKCQLWVRVEAFEPQPDPVFYGDSLALKLLLLEASFTLYLPGTLKRTRFKDALDTTLVKNALVCVIMVQFAEKFDCVSFQLKTASIS